jgi:hypothetical protein
VAVAMVAWRDVGTVGHSVVVVRAGPEGSRGNKKDLCRARPHGRLQQVMPDRISNSPNQDGQYLFKSYHKSIALSTITFNSFFISLIWRNTSNYAKLK